MKRVQESFQEKLTECAKHVQKIQDAKEFLHPLIPLDITMYHQLGKIESSFIDQLIYRFSKLQDTMGESLFRGILILAQEDVKSKTFLDILNRLEELGVVQKEQWLRLRELRNEIVHEYSCNEEEVVVHINTIYESADELIAIYDRVRTFVAQKFGISMQRH